MSSDNNTARAEALASFQANPRSANSTDRPRMPARPATRWRRLLQRRRSGSFRHRAAPIPWVAAASTEPTAAGSTLKSCGSAAVKPGLRCRWVAPAMDEIDRLDAGLPTPAPGLPAGALSIAPHSPGFRFSSAINSSPSAAAAARAALWIARRAFQKRSNHHEPLAMESERTGGV
jgi:hypothetical protein